MSIMAIILNPRDDEERAFSIPVSTEKQFQNNWLPLCEKLDLKWLPLFESGVDVELEDLEIILEELNKFKKAAKMDFPIETSKEISTRIDNLSQGLKNILRTKEVTVFIG